MFDVLYSFNHLLMLLSETDHALCVALVESVHLEYVRIRLDWSL